MEETENRYSEELTEQFNQKDIEGFTAKLMELLQKDAEFVFRVKEGKEDQLFKYKVPKNFPEVERPQREEPEIGILDDGKQRMMDRLIEMGFDKFISYRAAQKSDDLNEALVRIGI